MTEDTGQYTIHHYGDPKLNRKGMTYHHFGGYLLPQRYGLGVDHESVYPFLIELEVETTPESGPQCRKLTLEARAGGPPLTSTSIREVPVARLIRYASRRVALRSQDIDEKGKVSLNLFGLPREEAPELYAAVQRPRTFRNRVTRETLEQVADIYRAAVASGEPPTQKVAESMHVARSTAGRWVTSARREGFLGPAIPRKAGERKERKS